MVHTAYIICKKILINIILCAKQRIACAHSMHAGIKLLPLKPIMKKILFIEDESALQRAVTHILDGRGYKTLSAMDGENGIALAKQEKPDLILLDLIIPKKDGFAVLEELKKDPSTAHIPIIVLTNLEGGADVERALALGATTYLVKTNYKLEDIVEKIKRIIGEE